MLHRLTKGGAQSQSSLFRTHRSKKSPPLTKLTVGKYSVMGMCVNTIYASIKTPARALAQLERLVLNPAACLGEVVFLDYS